MFFPGNTNTEQKEKPLPCQERIIHIRNARLHSSFVQLLRQTSLLPIGSILMNYALGRSLVDHSGGRGQLLICVGRICTNSSLKLADRSTHTAFHNTIAKILLLTDLNALFCGLDIRQLGSPPLRILKKPSHGIISCLLINCNPFQQKIC